MVFLEALLKFKINRTFIERLINVKRPLERCNLRLTLFSDTPGG